MKMTDLIEALAAEIEHAQTQLVSTLLDLEVRTVDDDLFLDAFDQYSGQAQRMGEAAELAGFPGLQAVCAHVVQNCLLLTVTPVENREPILDFLRGWPPLIVYYLRNLSDPSAAVGLVDHLQTAPDPMADEAAKKIVHMLGAMQLQVAQQENERVPRPSIASIQDVDLTLPDDIDDKLLEGFQQEAPDLAHSLVNAARQFTSSGQAFDLVAAKRFAHTLKGTGAIVGLRGITSISHYLEDIFEHLERDGSRMTPQLAAVILDGAFCLEQMVGYVLEADDFPQQSLPVLQGLLDLTNRIDRGEALDEPTSSSSHIASKASSAMLEVQRENSDVQASPRLPPRSASISPAAAIRVNMQRIEELFRVSGEVSVHTAAMETHIKALMGSASELLAQNLRVQRRLFELETVVDVRSLSVMRGSSGDRKSSFDPLELDQYSELHSTSHALMEEAADARQLAIRLEDEIAQVASLQTHQQRLNKDLQHLVIGTRMTEVGVLASRLHRNVRTTCQATGKEAELVIEGASTLVDSDVLNRFSEPLLHLLRNAVDHGLETPQARQASGKQPIGQIVLSFSRQGQQIVLRCQDDGRGLDLLAIQRRAVERGVLESERPMTDDEIARLILLPGFSTRDSVSEVSGRGVGLDVVHNWVVAMNGAIRVTSQSGRGCTFELRFAASLSTMQTLIVEVSGQSFALPSVQVEQAVPRGVGILELVGEQLVYQYDRRIYPAQRLVDIVGLRADETKAFQDLDVVIVQVDDQSHALAVDRLADSRELLVKSPGRYARHVNGVAGLSILGDGSVAVNLDLTHLLNVKEGVSARAKAPPAALPKQELPGVLIVDDALTVRNALRQLVQDAGYRVQAARDGVEAINALRDFKPIAVLTDLEMPNMNGVELTSHIRGRDDMKGVPIIMITSRSQEKHRRMAEEAGVTAYITKPYNDSDLLQTIRRHVVA